MKFSRCKAIAAGLFFITAVAVAANAPHADAAQRAVDPGLVGTWEIPAPGGRLVWVINPDGTYNFHGEGAFAIPHAGTFTAGNGRWSLQATNGFADSGTYDSKQLPNVFSGTGQSGAAVWRHPSSNAINDNSGFPLLPRNPPRSDPGPGPAIGGKGGGIFNCNPCNGPIAK